ncbi:hypothetical protein [Pararhodobacter oceanensis]|uniref:hypothetical protein n=1 Tax=Pararhodobacter oceanensis TaxID=2172121 RepID=UPI003A94BC19
MILERTIRQLDTGPMPPDAARQLGQLGYMQWIAALPGRASYRRLALEAQAKAAPFAEASPAVAVFCALLAESLAPPLQPLDLRMPPRRRQGGASARRARRLPL